MTELIRNTPALIKSIGNNPVALAAFIFLIVVVLVYDFFSKEAFQEKLRVTLLIMIFGSMTIAIVSITTNPVSIILTPSNTQTNLKLSLINLAGLGIGVIGLIESISVIYAETDKNISVIGLTLLIFGVALAIWQPSPEVALVLGILGRMVGAFGVVIVAESLFYPDFHSLQFESGSGIGLGIGLITAIIGICISLWAG